MTEQELVEALEERLYAARESSPLKMDASEMPRMAEECLRQMKWAVSSCRLQVDLTTTGRKATAIFVPGLAPEDFGIEGEAEKA